MILKQLEKLRDWLISESKGINNIMKIIIYYLLMIPSAIYVFIAFFRRFLFRKNILKSYKVNAAVISLGNILLGGTGKTPLAIYLVKELKKKGFVPAVISRGYGRVNENKETVIVSKGSGPLFTYKIAGDEPWLIATETKGVIVVVSADRVKAANLAINLGANIIILDDGFQHLKIKRDCDILLFSELNEKYCNFLTLGFLREHISNHKYANILLSTGVNEVTPFIKKIAKNRKSFAATYNPVAFYSPKIKQDFPLDYFKNKKVMAFCGLANSQSFKQTLMNLDLNLLHFEDSFQDHEKYSFEKFDYLNKKRIELNVDYLLTTTKDMMKIDEENPLFKYIFALKVEFKINNGELFIEEILKYIDIIR